jgi:hypothetical protein
LILSGPSIGAEMSIFTKIAAVNFLSLTLANSLLPKFSSFLTTEALASIASVIDVIALSTESLIWRPSMTNVAV